MKIAVIKNGGANFLSVTTAIKKHGVECVLTEDPEVICQSDGVVLPGVGAAGFAMKVLRDNNLVEVIRNLKQPVLGVCLGMQLLFTHSTEDSVDCLDIIPGIINKFDNNNVLVPHMGWNSLNFSSKNADPILSGIENDSDVYFVHSYYAPITSYTIASCDYGRPFSAIVKCNNFYGMQFHPEKSGVIGQQLLKNFIRVVYDSLPCN